MSGTTIFPSEHCYLTIHEHSNGGLERYTTCFRNFVEHDCRTSGYPARVRIENWNGTIINDVIVFKTEQDKMWFILRWS